MEPIKKGERFLVTRDWEANAITHWAAAFTGGEICRVPKGTKLVVAYDQAIDATAVVVKPLNYKELESVLISEETRKTEKYAGYSLVLGLEEIGNYAEKIQA